MVSKSFHKSITRVMKYRDTISYKYLLPKKDFSAILVYLFLLITPLLSFAQFHEPDFEKVSIEIDGTLLYTNIVSIKQDHQGFLWMTTPDGLLRYDGYQFKIYKNIPGDTTSVIFNNTEALYVDHIGDLWIGTDKGLMRYESDCDCFTQYTVDPNNAVPTGIIITITEDTDHNIWIGMHNGGLFRYERKRDKFIRFLDDPKDPNTLGNEDVRVLLADRQNQIWIGTGYYLESGQVGGLFRFDPATGKTKRFLHDPDNPNSLIDNRVSAIMEDNKGRILVGTYQSGLHYYDQEKDELVRMTNDSTHPDKLYAPKGKRVWSTDPSVSILFQDKKGGYWVGTCGGGINHFEQGTNKVSHYLPNPDDQNGISNEYLWSFYEDRYGQFWLGNLAGGGLHKMNPHQPWVRRYDQLNNSGVNSIVESQFGPGAIYLGTRFEGLLQLDVKRNQIKPVLKEAINSYGIKARGIRTVHEDSNGILWMGFGDGFFDGSRWQYDIGNGAFGRLDPRTASYKQYVIPRNDSLNVFNNTVYDIHGDREGVLWLGTGPGGLFRFDKEQEILERINLPSKKNQAGNAEISFVKEDSSGTLWIGDIGREGALFRYNPQNDSLSSFLEGYKPNSFYEDKEGWFWIGSLNKGLLHFRPDQGNLKQFTMIDGLSSNRIEAITEGPDGIFWVATDLGISKFDSMSNRFKTLSLPPYGFWNAMKASDGQLFFTGNTTLFSFYPDQQSGNLIPPDIVLTGLTISGESYVQNNVSLNMTKEISLTHLQNDISFEYVGLHFGNPLLNKYKYKLEPYDKDWIEAGTQRESRYTNLDPGEYSFQVKGSNDNNVWNEKGVSLRILIAPPWWTTWWAYTVYGILFIAGLFFIDRLQRRRLLEKSRVQAKEKELEQAKAIKKAYDKLEKTHSNLKATQAQLIQSEKMASLGELTAGIAHEIQNPLNFVNNFSEVSNELIDEMNEEMEKGDMEEAKAIADDVKQNLVKILHHGQRADAIVKGMLQHSRATGGAKEPTDINALADEYLRLAYHGLRAKDKTFNATMNTDFDPSIIKVNVVPQDIGRVILNLITNAFYAVTEKSVFAKASADAYEPTVWLSTKKDKNQIMISVRDNGNGIPEKVLDKIFQPFFTTKPTGQGTGLGLSLSYDIIKAHNGKLKVETKEGAGTTFTIQLPAI